MKYTYIIIEDDVNAVENLKLALEKEKSKLECIEVATNYDDALCKIREYLPQLIFLDVNLEDHLDRDGFSLLQEVRRELPVFPMVIMFTGDIAHGKNAVNNDVVYFLSKPVDPTELRTAINRFYSRAQIEYQELMVNTVHSGINFVKLSDIVYITTSRRENFADSSKNTEKDYIVIKTNTSQKDKGFKLKSNLTKMMDQLPHNFVRIHDSYIVNLRKIVKFGDRKLYFNNKITSTKEREDFLPISDRYLPDLKSRFFQKKYLL